LQGWIENKEKGDAHFKAQRAKADQADHARAEGFYIMMQQIAEEMHTVTGALEPFQQEQQLKCLDICMAPGGYTAAVLKRHPDAKCFGITLPTKQGGHPLYVSTKVLAGLKQLDVTMLANEYTTGAIPRNHPAYSEFIHVRPFNHYKFDLIFCDGMVLRTQERPSYREQVEVTRLACSQMILALQRIAAGGTIVMLLHKIDSFQAAFTLHTFSKFAEVDSFKPARKHGTRSSFYMVAKNVQPQSTAALSAIKDWKDSWWQATFGGEEGTGERKEDPPESVVRQMLEEYGERLIEMGRPIWGIQADNLSRTDYAGDGSAQVFQNRRASLSSSHERTPRAPTSGKNFDWGRAREENVAPVSPLAMKMSDMDGSSSMSGF
jgi:23S rRNA U2552 (ribose-2'-O)-methylase RlmE/FtsJ